MNPNSKYADRCHFVQRCSSRNPKANTLWRTVRPRCRRRFSHECRSTCVPRLTTHADATASTSHNSPRQCHGHQTDDHFVGQGAEP